MTYKLLLGDCLETLKTIEPYSVSCCVTSPPYYGLRDYQTARWEGESTECDHLEQATGSTQNKGNNGKYGTPYTKVCGKCGAIRVDSQIGLEESPERYVEKLVQVFREVRRVLKDDGTLWLNLGDSYAGSGKGPTGYNGIGDQETRQGFSSHGARIGSNHGESGHTSGVKPPIGYKPKDLLGIPWLVAFALRADGWYLRSDIIWAKPNPMTESVTDRPTKSHEYIFLLSKSARYYYDNEAIAETITDSTIARLTQPNLDQQAGSDRVPGKTNGNMKAVGQAYSFKRKVNESPKPGERNQHRADREDIEYRGKRNKRTVWTVTTKPYKEAHFATYPPDLIEPCILAGSREGDTVLDPFNGSGTTGAVAIKHHRNYIGCELNPDYIRLTKKRLAQVQYVFPRIDS